MNPNNPPSPDPLASPSADPSPQPTTTPPSPPAQPSTPAKPQVFGPQQSAPVFQSTPDTTPIGIVPQQAEDPPIPGVKNIQFSDDNGIGIIPTKKSVPPPVKPPRRKKAMLFVGLVFLLVLLVGSGGAYAYYTVMMNKPEKVLADALTNTVADVLDRKPTSAIGTVSYEYKDGATGKVTLNYSLKSADEKYQADASLHMQLDSTDITIKGAAISAGDESFYFKFDDIKTSIKQLTKNIPDANTMIAAYNPLIDKIDGKWIEIDKQSLVDYGFVQSQNEVDKCSDAVKNLRLSKDDQKKVKKIFIDNQFVFANENLAKEDIDGVKSYHYKLDFNDEASIKFAMAFVQLDSFKTVKTDCNISQDDLQKDLDNLQKEAKDQTDEPQPIFELWVNTKTRRVNKIKVTMDDKSLTMTFVTTVKINDVSVNVEAPKNAINIKDLKAQLESILGISLDDASASNSTANNVALIGAKITESISNSNGTIAQNAAALSRSVNTSGVVDPTTKKAYVFTDNTPKTGEIQYKTGVICSGTNYKASSSARSIALRYVDVRGSLQCIDL